MKPYPLPDRRKAPRNPQDKVIVQVVRTNEPPIHILAYDEAPSQQGTPPLQGGNEHLPQPGADEDDDVWHEFRHERAIIAGLFGVLFAVGCLALLAEPFLRSLP